MGLAISVPRDRLTRFCKDTGIRRMAFFGSVTRDDFGPDSDIDIVVEFAPGRTPGFAFFKLQDELSQILGRQVDLQTPGFLGRVWPKVQGDLVEAYAAS